jgi:hypothetical protein
MDVSKSGGSYHHVFKLEGADRDSFHRFKILSASPVLGRRIVSDLRVVFGRETSVSGVNSGPHWTVFRCLEGYPVPQATIFSAPDASPVPAYVSGQFVFGVGSVTECYVDPRITLDSGDSLWLLVQVGNGSHDGLDFFVSVWYKVSFVFYLCFLFVRSGI